jgi:hypothetical protein
LIINYNSTNAKVVKLFEITADAGAFQIVALRSYLWAGWGRDRKKRGCPSRAASLITVSGIDEKFLFQLQE